MANGRATRGHQRLLHGYSLPPPAAALAAAMARSLIILCAFQSCCSREKNERFASFSEQ